VLDDRTATYSLEGGLGMVSALKPRPLYLRFEDDDLMIDDDVSA